MVLYLVTVSFGDGYFFSQLKENSSLIKHIGTIYIDFYKYPPYSGRKSEIFETNVNNNMQCDYNNAQVLIVMTR